MKIAIAQINTTVGDLKGNYEKITQYISSAKKSNVDLIIFPELALPGYPPKDLLAKKSFVNANKKYLSNLKEQCDSIHTIVGFVDSNERGLFNAAAHLGDKKILDVYHKINLPNYDVFDEKRYFLSGKSISIIDVQGTKIGLQICEDIWVEDGPFLQQSKEGVDFIINISASPFHTGKAKVREELLSRRSRDTNTPLIYVNTIGAQDDLIFDGRSYVFSKKGKMVTMAKAFEEDMIILDGFETSLVNHPENVTEDTYNSLVLGVRDYFRKNGFKKAVLGLSGGIDSALTAVLATKALGKENVIGVSMPSMFSSLGSVDDARDVANNLGIQYEIIPIKGIYESYLKSLNPVFKQVPFNVAEENVQARIRGNLLMALSNKYGYLVLTTGNKSELSVGYATLYGDMAGGLAVISDVFKTKVYELSNYINNKEGREIIPKSTLIKEPSAELRENQKDSDSLPIYAILDPILKAYVEEDKSKEEIISLGFDEATVNKVISMVDRNEYKRQQAALGLRITPRAFGSGRRMPITNRWKE